MCGDNESRVERGASHGNAFVNNAHAVESIRAGRETVSSDANNERTGLADRLLTHEFGVADDEVERQPGLQSHVGSAVDGDHERADLGSPTRKRTQLSLRVGRAGHEENRPLTEVTELWNVDSTQHCGAIFRQVILNGGVDTGEKGGRVGDVDVQVVRRHDGSGRDNGAVHEDLRACHRHLLTFAQRHNVLAQVIDEDDAGLENEARPQRGCASRQRRLRVQHGHGIGCDKRRGALAIQVRNVDDGDFAAF